MKIDDHEKQFYSSIELSDDDNLFIFVGGNNSGKSTLLRSIYKTFNQESYIVSVNRTVLDGEGSLDKNYQKNYSSYKSQFTNSSDDNWTKSFKVLQDFFNLNDSERVPILEWYNTYFPNKIYEERENNNNSASPMLLKVNGHSITKQGSGMRATLEIFIQLFSSKIKNLCIDEPELGLEPYLQKYLFQAIKDKISSDKKIYIATHSHHFLDYESINNNYICKRNSGNKIYIERVDDLKPVIFRLLGNSLASFLLPEYILILEGSSDTVFLNKCLQLLGKKNYAIHNSGSNTNIKYAVNAINQFLKFNNGISVYKENIYVIADKAKDTLIREWKKILTNEDKQLKVLQENGIEYYYPEKILQDIFTSTHGKHDIVEQYLQSNSEFNGMRITKNELAKKVSEKLNVNDLDDPINELFVFLKTFT